MPCLVLADCIRVSSHAAHRGQPRTMGHFSGELAIGVCAAVKERGESCEEGLGDTRVASASGSAIFSEAPLASCAVCWFKAHTFGLSALCTASPRPTFTLTQSQLFAHAW